MSRLKRLEDGILLNGCRVTVRATLTEGDLLSLAAEDRPEEVNPALTPSDFRPEVLYEDEWLLAVNKPPFMPTHPSAGHQGDTLANALAGYFADRGIPFIFRAVNRLDRDTSGIVLLSKDKHTAGRLATEMEAGGLKKSYLALLMGQFPAHAPSFSPAEGSIVTHLRRKAGSKMLRETFWTPCENTVPAITHYEVLSRSGGCPELPDGLTLLRAMPQTGRTHQLRVQFSFCGHPILGDSLYGSPSPLISRQALHAESLTFSHPVNGQVMTLFAPLPPDIQSLSKEFFHESIAGA